MVPNTSAANDQNAGRSNTLRPISLSPKLPAPDSSVENGFQLLADETLESEHWKRYRNYALANLALIANQALTEVRSSLKSTGSS